MEEKKIFEGLIEEAKRVTKENEGSGVMMIMFEKCDDCLNSLGLLLGKKCDLTISLSDVMEESIDLVDIVRAALIMNIKNELEK